MSFRNKGIITVLLLSIFLSFNLSQLVARDSPFTRKGTGPKYWIAYEYCWVNNTHIPESRWKANIDWVDKNFKEYGYDMICNDGWIETSQIVNENGYIIKYNDDWQHGFKYWAEYLAERDMKLGVYYNPMWMTKAAYDQNLTVKGTKITTQQIAGPISFNEPLYWVDVDREGAKEWIQGYVKYFIEQGATYLRIDFLENYEKNYGTAKYKIALDWIKEAAGNDLFLSLVMPNCFDHGRNEIVYGDMIRIDDDCFEGGWEFVSNRRRGEQKALWPQFGNMFDGFLGFADIGGRGQLILDGDFMRLNTMANDNERMFKFSLMVMGGSALCIADQFDTIEDHAWIYQNKELLDLNDQGLVAKPLSYDKNDVSRSSTWAGQLPDGDWIVGLFNREDTKQIRKVDFQNDLGLNGSIAYDIRDLWEHSDIDKVFGGYSVELEPHACQIIRIKANDLKFEAEFASMIGETKPNNMIFQYSGTGYVESFDKSDSKVLFAVEVPSKGEYSFEVAYANPSNNIATASLYVNDKKVKSQISMAGLGKDNIWAISNMKITLEKGLNYISIQKDQADNGLFILDYIKLKR